MGKASLDPDWERQWILVCLGFVSLATLALAAALAVVDLADFAYRAQDQRDLLQKFARMMILTAAGFCYLAVVIRAGPAIFNTDYELARERLTRRTAVARVYRLVFFEILLLSFLVFLVVAGAFTPEPEAIQVEPDRPASSSRAGDQPTTLRYTLASVQAP